MVRFGWGLSFLIAGALPVFAHSYGPPPAVTGAPGDNAKACTQCHAGALLNSGTGSVKITTLSGPVYMPGVRQRVFVQISDPTQQRWGFELTARLDSDPTNTSAGELIPVDNQTQVICADAGAKPCSGLSFIEHTSVGTRNGTKNSATFQFDWTPPATNIGSVTFYVAGNAANGNGSSSGDLIYTASLQLKPVAATAPSVPTGNLVSSIAPGSTPIGAFSWVSAYGTNLSATTRSWDTSDFVNGAFPTALDGTSVVLTYFGAPRLATVGYVSPTQVNFLLPSDTAATAVQVQVRNPAGITTQQPITVAAAAPQLLTTSDGKHVFGTHADGTTLSQSAAAKGETITLYATGCGPTNPVLTPGIVPSLASPLNTAAQITIGNAPATAASATVLPGAGGVYQLTVQVPAQAASGDSPVVIQIGTFTSVSGLLTVR